MNSSRLKQASELMREHADFGESTREILADNNAREAGSNTDWVDQAR